jgi:argininosuccinate lyase
MNKLWQTKQKLHTLIEEYTSGDDVVLDSHLIYYDILGSLAHVQMLKEVHLIDQTDFTHIKTGLLHILDEYQKGQYQLKKGDEDVHTRIEYDITQQYPESGGKLHTGRSRNDQVLTDLRLFIKDNLLQINQDVHDVVSELYVQAKKFQHTPLPGMTHMQPAMVSSVGLWLAALAESLLDDLQILQIAYNLNDQSPLGSGASYGVSLPIDRKLTAQLLGFAKVQNNALYCQNSRGKIESFTLHALMQIMATLNKFASDSLLYASEPFSFITFDTSLSTGSSIMPQKQNWDALELMRAKYHEIVAGELQANTTLSNLPSGYNRDAQLLKRIILSAFHTTKNSLKVAYLFLHALQVNELQINRHIPKSICSAYWVYQIMQEQSISYREAYKYVKDHLEEIPTFDVGEVLKQSCSEGAPGNPGFDSMSNTLRRRQRWLNRQTKAAKQTIEKLINNT